MRFTLRQQAFSLIEILVTLVILSTGFLGLTALQSTAITQTLNIATHSRATLRINALAERIRANPDIAGHYTVSLQHSDCGPAPPACGNTHPGCSAREIAAFDHWETLCAGSSLTDQGIALPDFNQLEVNCLAMPCSAASEYRIVLDWLPRAVESFDQATTSQPLSVTLRVKPR